MEDNNRLSYFFLGMGIGVAIGILFAPKSGEETRKLIRSKADEGKKYVKKRTEEVRESAEDLVERGREDIGDYNRIGRGARFFDDGPRRPDIARLHEA